MMISAQSATDPLWVLMLGGLGLVFGSFIATLALRARDGRSALHGRSTCDHCAKTLEIRDLVPVFSWMIQLGKCRQCGGSIHPAHLITEVLGMAVGITAALAAPGWTGAFGAVFGWLLLALAALDLAAFWLPNVLTGIFAASGLISALFLSPTPRDHLLGGIIGFGMLWAVGAIYRRMRGRIGLGGGDPKMFGGIGLWLGASMLAPVLLAASVTGLLIAIGIKASGRKIGMTSRLPLGTLLAIAAYPAWLYIHWG